MASLRDWTPEYFVKNEAACKAILEDADVLNELPSLNNGPLYNFKDQQLVRFRGMVQDMYNPEYYFQWYEVTDAQTGTRNVRCGLYMDTARCMPHEEIILDSDKNKCSERQTCVVVSTPGLNDWAKEKYSIVDNGGTISYRSCAKRNIDKIEDESVYRAEPNKKREKDRDVANGSTSDSKTYEIPSKERTLNFPIPIRDGKACIIKMYDEAVWLKLNRVVEIIGFLSFDSQLSTIYDTTERTDESETQTHDPPASSVPTIHAIKVEELSKIAIPDASEIVSKAEAIREDLRIIFTQLLFGDNLAADYLICHLLSSIYSRRDCLCLGTYPINITRFPLDKCETFPTELYEFLSLLVRKSHFLELTLDGLNNLSLAPKKDYERDRLTSGILQLSDNTHLVIDETRLNSGPVSTNGKSNYKAISDLISFQKVTYDFKYYTMDYETDIPILILSEAKSFLPCETQIALMPDAESVRLYPEVLAAAKHYLNDENRLNNIRHYLESLRGTEIGMDKDIANEIQEDFALLRQANKSITVDSLHSLIVLARLMSLSFGVNTVTSEYWKKTVRMEIERTGRLPQRNK